MSQENGFPFPVRTLANEKVKLTLFTPELHAETYFESSVSHPELYAHITIDPFASQADFVERFLLEKKSKGWLTMAIIDKTKPPSSADEEGELAGMVTFMNTSATHLSTEIGAIVILPKFHRTHVTSNVVGLMLQHSFRDPEDGGMGLRRVVWMANSLNLASIRVAERMGFRREGLMRWHYVFRNGAETGKLGNGRPLPRGSREGDLGRDTVILGLCWDDWEDGTREMVQKAMDRTA